MFIIGLELNPPSCGSCGNLFWRRGGAGVTQRGHSRGTADVDAVFRQAAVIGGIGLAMSSTAMALQLMRDKGMNRNEAGQLGFSVLLFRDLAVIPALALVPLLAGSGDDHFDWMKISMKVLAFAGMLIGGRFYCVRYSGLLQHPACARYSPPQRCCWCLAQRCLWMRWGCRWRLGRLSPGCCLRKASTATSWRPPSIRLRAAARAVLYLGGYGA